MTMTYDEIARGVVQVTHGNSAGSGFHLLHDDIVVTNSHVIRGGFGGELRAHAEDGESVLCDLAVESLEGQHDYAVLKMRSKFSQPRTLFEPGDRPARGADLAIAGYPHGIPDLLVHRVTMSGPSGDQGFHLDGSINGGNSGGPVIDPATGKVVGIVTARRYVGGADMQALADQARQLQQHAMAMNAEAHLTLMGIDFGSLINMLGGSLSLIERVASANANSGIGVAYHIEHVAQHFPPGS